MNHLDLEGSFLITQLLGISIIIIMGRVFYDFFKFRSNIFCLAINHAHPSRGNTKIWADG